MRNSENVLNSLAGHSQDPNYKFERLYRLMYNENLYATAYQNIAPNTGNCTKGADGQSIDGMSVKRIHNLIDRPTLSCQEGLYSEEERQEASHRHTCL